MPVDFPRDRAGATLRPLRRRAHPEGIERLSPLVHEFINMHGGYYFSLLEEMQRGEPSEIRETQFRSCNCPGTTLKHQDFVPLLLGPPFKGLVDPSLPSADYSFRLVLFRHWRSCCFHIRLGITLLSGIGFLMPERV